MYNILEALQVTYSEAHHYCLKCPLLIDSYIFVCIKFDTFILCGI